MNTQTDENGTFYSLILRPKGSLVVDTYIHWHEILREIALNYLPLNFLLFSNFPGIMCMLAQILQPSQFHCFQNVLAS